MVAVYDSKGRVIVRTICESRKHARREFARVNSCKWNDLWCLGFKVGTYRPEEPNVEMTLEKWTKTH